jgi:MFS transporter, CP family, cyanate transporter
MTPPAAVRDGAEHRIRAFGPMIAGVLHDVTGSWTIPLVFLLALLVPQLWAALLGGRARTINPEH